MASSAATRWLLTAVFAGLGGYCLVRCALPAALPHRLSGWLTDALGVAMCAATVAMLWGLPLGDRWGVQLALFGAAGGWYLVRAARPDAERVALLHHGASMAAMVWMLAAARAGTATMVTMPARPAAVGPVGALIAAYLALAALWWARSALRPDLAATHGTFGVPVVLFGDRGGAACQAVMAAAMCGALLAR